MVLSHGINIGALLGNVYGIILGIDIVTDLGSIDISFDGYNYDKFGGLFNVDSLKTTYIKVLGSDEGVKLGLSHGKVLVVILINAGRIIFQIYFGTEL